jgi:hypothetical protein
MSEVDQCTSEDCIYWFTWHVLNCIASNDKWQGENVEISIRYYKVLFEYVPEETEEKHDKGPNSGPRIELDIC